MNLEIFTIIGLPVALALIMFAMGLSLLPSNLVAVFYQPRAVLTGLFAQLFVVPALAFLVVLLTGLQGPLAVGLMVLSFSPGGTTSNLFSYFARADVPLSITLTTLASIVTPFSLPLLAAWTLDWQISGVADFHFPVAVTILRLVVVMLFPLALGLLWHRYWPDAASRVRSIVQPLAVSLFVAVIAAMVVQRWPVLGSWIEQLGVAVSALMISTFLFGWLVAKAAGLASAQQKTLAIEVGMQNGGTALLLTQGVLRDPQMSSVPLLYGLLMLVPVLFIVWAGRSEAG